MVYNTSVVLGTGNFEPLCLSEKSVGGTPELSVQTGGSQSTPISEPVALVMIWSGGQNPQTGASVSKEVKAVGSSISSGFHSCT